MSESDIQRTIQLPLKPFSVNQAWRGGRRYCSKHYLAWKKEGAWLLKGQPSYSGWVEVRIRAYMKRWKNSDVDNVIKPTIDLLVEAGVLVDDKWVRRVSAEKFSTAVKTPECLEIEIVEL